MRPLLFRTASVSLEARRITVVAHEKADTDARTGSGQDLDVLAAIHYIAIFLLIVMSAIASGLTLGFMSLDKSDPFYKLKGLVTLEDIVEEILQSKITDETDSLEARQKRQNCTNQIR